jgi:hypothetical protein
VPPRPRRGSFAGSEYFAPLDGLGAAAAFSQAYAHSQSAVAIAHVNPYMLGARGAPAFALAAAAGGRRAPRALLAAAAVAAAAAAAAGGDAAGVSATAAGAGAAGRRASFASMALRAAGPLLAGAGAGVSAEAGAASTALAAASAALAATAHALGAGAVLPARVVPASALAAASTLQHAAAVSPPTYVMPAAHGHALTALAPPGALFPASALAAASAAAAAGRGAAPESATTVPAALRAQQTAQRGVAWTGARLVLMPPLKRYVRSQIIDLSLPAAPGASHGPGAGRGHRRAGSYFEEPEPTARAVSLSAAVAALSLPVPVAVPDVLAHLSGNPADAAAAAAAAAAAGQGISPRLVPGSVSPRPPAGSVSPLPSADSLGRARSPAALTARALSPTLSGGSQLGASAAAAAAAATAAAGVLAFPAVVTAQEWSTATAFLPTSPARLARVREDPPERSPRTLDKMYPSEFKRIQRFMLFADVKNYSKLTEEVLPLFNAYFLQLVRTTMEGMRRSRPDEGSVAGAAPSAGEGDGDWASVVEHASTWGDGLLCVFADAVDCAEFALKLLSKVNRTQWTSVGLPATTTVRIGVHAGPVFTGFDPLIHEFAYYGRHVERAAMIEPVTTAGCVFCTQQFAALLSLQQARVAKARRALEIDFVTTVQLQQEREQVITTKQSTKTGGGKKGAAQGFSTASMTAAMVDEYANCPLFNITWKEGRDPVGLTHTPQPQQHSASGHSGNTGPSPSPSPPPMPRQRSQAQSRPLSSTPALSLPAASPRPSSPDSVPPLASLASLRGGRQLASVASATAFTGASSTVSSSSAASVSGPPSAAPAAAHHAPVSSGAVAGFATFGKRGQVFNFGLSQQQQQQQQAGASAGPRAAAPGFDRQASGPPDLARYESLL